MLRHLLPALLLLSACAPFNRYGTARTLSEGQSRTSVILDAAGGIGPGMDEADTAVPMPRVQLNQGIADGTETVLDVGLGFAGFDVKHELFRSREVGLALAPGLSLGWYDHYGFGEVHAPVLVDLALAPWLVFTPQASVGWGVRLDDSEVGVMHGALVGAGAGLFFRISDGFSIQPVVSSTLELDTFYFHQRAGIAFAFGNQPVY